MLCHPLARLERPVIRSASPSMLFRCRSSPGRKSPEPRPRLVVSTHALPVESSDGDVRRSRPARARRRAARRRARAPVPARRGRGRSGRRVERRREVREPRAACGASNPRNSTSTGSPSGLVGRQVLRRHEPAALLHQLQQRAPDRPLVGAARPVFGERLERARRAPAAGAGRPHRGARRRASRSQRPRSSSSPARASRRHEAWAAAWGRRRARAAEQARRDAARAGGRARSRARRARQERPERRTSRSRRRSGRARSPKGTSSSSERDLAALASQPGNRDEAVEVRAPLRVAASK